MKLEFNNMNDFIKGMPKNARLQIHYIDKNTNKELIEEVKIKEINDNEDSIVIKNKNSDIKTVDILYILDIICLDKLKLVVDKENSIMSENLKVGDKVKIIKTDSIGTVKEIRNNSFDFPIKVHQFSIGYSDYKREDLELITRK